MSKINAHYLICSWNTGPSYTTDATWIGGTQALMRAKRMIEDGLINAAIIGSCNLCLNPTVSLQLEGLGRLNSSNDTRSYSADGIFINRNTHKYRYHV